MHERPTKAICNGWVKCKYKVLSSLLRLVTVDRYVFKSQPLQIAKRCGQAADTLVTNERPTKDDESIEQ
jgi:hypothetical protein